MEALGPLERCLILFLLGAALIAGYFLKWKWLYFPNNSKALNVAILIIGVIMAVSGVVFYVYRDSMNWVL